MKKNIVKSEIIKNGIFVLYEDGTVKGFGEKTRFYIPKEGLTNVKDIMSSNECIFFIMEDDDIFASGSLSYLTSEVQDTYMPHNMSVLYSSNNNNKLVNVSVFDDAIYVINKQNGNYSEKNIVMGKGKSSLVPSKLSESNIAVSWEEILLSDVEKTSVSDFGTLFLKENGNVIFYKPSYNNNNDIFEEFKLGADNIFSGEKSLFATTKEGKVYSMGSNSFGELGLADYEERLVFEETNYLKNLKSVNSYSRTSIFLINDGSVYICGDSLNDVFNIGIVGKINIPKKIDSLKNVTSVSNVDNLFLFVVDNKDLYIAGAGHFGASGFLKSDEDEDVFTPLKKVNLDFLERIK